MTYQGARARPMATENGRCFEVSKVRLGADGRVTDVLWAEVDRNSDHNVSAQVLASAAEVIDAMHDGAQVAAVFLATKEHGAERTPERMFVIVEHRDGRECIAFEGSPSAGRDLVDMASLSD